jgi:hypothetical protein
MARGKWVGPKGNWHNVSDGTQTPGLKIRFDPNGDIQIFAEVDARPHQTWRVVVVRHPQEVGESSVGPWGQAWELVAEATAKLPAEEMARMRYQVKP